MKQDKRSQRTRAWLLETLLELLEKKEYTEISITELTEKADIARQTFYRNYDSMDDILLTEMDTLLDEYIERVQKHMETKKNMTWEFEVKEMVYMWQHNEALFKALPKAGLGLHALEKLSEFFSLFHMQVQHLEELDEYNQCLVHYLAGGVYMVLKKWFESEMSTPVEVITDIFKKAAGQIDRMSEERKG